MLQFRTTLAIPRCDISKPGNQSDSPSQHLNSLLANVALGLGMVSLCTAVFIRLSNCGWSVIACFLLYAVASAIHLAAIILAWKWDWSILTSLLSVIGSALLFVAFFVQYDYGDGPSFISGLAFFDPDIESRNSMPEYFRWASYTTNYLVFIPCAAAWGATIALAKRNQRREIAKTAEPSFLRNGGK